LIAVHAFLSRILGWADERRQVDRALRSLREMVARRSPLVLLGEGESEVVSVAHSLHQRMLGDNRPS